MCEGHYDILTNEGPRGDTVFLPAEGPELDALADRMGRRMCHQRCWSCADPDISCRAATEWSKEARRAIEALRQIK